jgi:NAD(P)-dependent dehydrogenase (short-subunit alcohol dehydrogenase family)
MSVAQNSPQRRGRILMSPINNPEGHPLQGQVALVTGGSRGIGKAIAAKLARLGASVSVCGRDPQALQATAEQLRALPVKVLAQAADVTKAADIAALVHATETQLGPITLLVNNAGIGNPGFGPVNEKSEGDWDRVLDTNLKSAFLVSRTVAPLMIQRRRGDIINISSLAGKTTFAGGALYCASKWGLQGLTGCMAEDLRQYGIRVSVICPGSVATEFSGRGPKDPSKVLTADDVAHAVAMLALQGPQSFLSEVHLRPVAKP